MDQDDIVREFLIETHENLDRLDRSLVHLERAPEDRETLASIFRSLHTLKGTAGFLAFPRLESISHAGESLLCRLRDGALRMNAPITSALLRMLDEIRAVLAAIESTGLEPAGDDSALIADLRHLAARDPDDDACTPPATAADQAVQFLEALAAEDERRGGGDRRSGDDRRQGVTDASLRVDVGLLDRLMTLVHDLAESRDRIVRFASTERDAEFLDATRRLDLVTTELRESVMRTRLQPIGELWGRLPRVVRDLAALCGKQARIEMVATETDLDRTIVEAIRDPLTHVIRNAVGHGIEPPEVRLARGKPAQGLIVLRAVSECRHVTIEISDDGAGIDPDRVRAKAVERGVLSAERARGMSDDEAARLVFLPGLSTADAVTNVSGRGVGLDVVKTNVERIGGTVQIRSVAGEGTTLRIRVPLAPAGISPAASASGRVAIPQAG